MNSLFDNVAFNFSGGDLSFAFNTVFINGTFSFVVNCTNPNVALIENNVLLKIGNQGVQDAIQGNACTANHNLLSPQSTAIAGVNLVMDPRLVDPTNHDLRLQTNSPAIDAAVPSTGLEPVTDFEGVVRPQGRGFDIGAFEHTP